MGIGGEFASVKGLLVLAVQVDHAMDTTVVL